MKKVIIFLFLSSSVFSLQISPPKKFSSPEGNIVKKIFEKIEKEKFDDIETKKIKWFIFDIENFCNRSHIDKTGNEWIGNRNVDLKYLKTGKVCFYGVPFYIINPSENKGKTCIMLGSDKFPDFPKEIKIPVNNKFNYLFFLHACAYVKWGDGREYRIIYDDGSKFSIPVVATGATAFGQDENIQDWFFTSVIKKPFVREVPVPFVRNPVSLSDIKYIYILKWKNPHPEKIIEKIELISGAGTTTLFIFAITGGRNE